MDLLWVELVLTWGKTIHIQKMTSNRRWYVPKQYKNYQIIAQHCDRFVRKSHIDYAVADPECARGGSVSHILAEKRVLASLYLKKAWKFNIFTNNRGGGRTPGTPYAGSATAMYYMSSLCESEQIQKSWRRWPGPLQRWVSATDRTIIFGWS